MFYGRPELRKPASDLNSHNLTGILESAIRSTNAQFEDASILERLDVRLLEHSPGDTGWDIFSMDYHMDGPIGTVSIVPKNMYCIVFFSIFSIIVLIELDSCFFVGVFILYIVISNAF